MASIGFATLEIIPSLRGVTEAIEKQIAGKTVKVTVDPSVDTKAAQKAGKEVGETVAKEAKSAVRKGDIGKTVHDEIKSSAKSSPAKEAAKAVVDGLADGIKKELPRGGVGGGLGRIVVDGIADGVKQGIDGVGIGGKVVDTIGSGIKSGNLGGTLRDAVVPAVKGIGKEIESSAAEWAKGIGDSLRSGDIQGATSDIGKTVENTTSLIAKIGSTFGLQLDGVRQFGKNSSTTLSTFGTDIQNTINSAVGIKSTLNELGNIFENVLPGRAGRGASKITAALSSMSLPAAITIDLIKLGTSDNPTWGNKGFVGQGGGLTKPLGGFQPDGPYGIRPGILTPFGGSPAPQVPVGVDINPQFSIGGSGSGSNQMSGSPGQGYPLPWPYRIMPGYSGGGEVAQPSGPAYNGRLLGGGGYFDLLGGGENFGGGTIGGGGYFGDALNRPGNFNPGVLLDTSRVGIEDANTAYVFWKRLVNGFGMPDRQYGTKAAGGLLGGGGQFGDASTDRLKGIPWWGLPEFNIGAQYSSGGYTGSMSADRIAGVVHGGEYVINARSTKGIQNRMPGLLSYLNNLPGYKGGGPVISSQEQQSMWDAIRSKFSGAVLISGTRTNMTEGHPDYHNAGRAIDLGGSGMGAMAAWIASNYPDSLELIHSPFGHNILNGMNVGDGMKAYGAGQMAKHRDHVHWALGKMAKAAISSADADMMSSQPMSGDMSIGSAISTPAMTATGDVSPAADSSKFQLPSSLSGLAGTGLEKLNPRTRVSPDSPERTFRVGEAAQAAIGGQVSSLLGLGGVNNAPGWLRGASELIGTIGISDKKSGDSVVPSAVGASAISAAGAALGGVQAGTGAQPVPQTVYNIQTTDLEPAYLISQRNDKERAAARYSQFA